jgi:hypothetical protein
MMIYEPFPYSCIFFSFYLIVMSWYSQYHLPQFEHLAVTTHEQFK